MIRAAGNKKVRTDGVYEDYGMDDSDGCVETQWPDEEEDVEEGDDKENNGVDKGRRMER